MADQTLSSLINLVVGVAAARAVSPREFGAFALALTVYWLALGANRALTSEPYVVRHGSAAAPACEELQAAAGTSASLGAVASLVCLGAAVIAGGTLGRALVALAAGFVFLLLQDFVRAASFATRRPSVAFAADATWLLAFVGGWVLLSTTHTTGLVPVMLAWGLAAGLAASVGLIQLGLRPHGEKARQWLREHRDIAPGFLVENVVLALSIQLSFFSVGAIAGLRETGAMRAAQVLFGPWQVLLMGTGLFAFPEAVRLLRSRGTRGLIWFSVGIAGGLTIASATTALMLFFLPQSVGRSLLGTSWPGAKPLILITGVSLCTTAAVAGPALGLRALAAVRRSVPLRVGTSAAVITCATGGAWADGARGALLGISLAGAAAAIAWWWQLWLECVAQRHAQVRPTPAINISGSEG